MPDFVRSISSRIARALGHTPGPDVRLEEARRRIAEQDREIARLKQEADTARAAREGGGPPVFFLVGRYKSGTSWLMRTLDSHPEILCRGEGRFFGRGWERGDLAHRDWTTEDIRRDNTGIPPRSLYGALSGADYLRLWLERSFWGRDEDPEEHLAWIARATTAHLLERKLAKAGKKIVGDKTPFLTADTVEEIGEVYPGARVIHIVRDGRDVTVSATHHRWNRAEDRGGRVVLGRDERELREAFLDNPQGGSREGMLTEEAVRNQARAWKEMVSRARQDGPALLGDHYAEVRYEDLLERPEEELGRLLEFLGADAGRETVERCVGAGSFEKLSKGRQRGEEDPTSFFRKGIAGDWKNVFTERDKQVFKETAGALLVELGYEKDNDW